MISTSMSYFKFYTILVACMMIWGCTDHTTQADLHSGASPLVVTNDRLEFITDSITPSTSRLIMVYYNNGRRYLTLLNSSYNEIIGFDIDTKEQAFRIRYDEEGPNGIGNLSGYYIKSMDSIYLCPKSKKTIYIGNGDGKIIKSINYGRYESDDPAPSPLAVTETPLIIDGSVVLVPAMPFGNWQAYNDLSDISVCASISLTHASYSYLPFYYPADYWKSGKTEPAFSRIKADGKYIWSFFADHYLYYTSDFKTTKKVFAGSDHIKAFAHWPSNMDMQDYLRYLAGTASYQSIIYDPFRKIYYRIATLSNDVQANDNLALLSKFPPKPSIIVLNASFEKIGETVLPERRFNIRDYFVVEEGLFLSNNNPMNPDFNQDKLSFTLIILRDDNEK